MIDWSSISEDGFNQLAENLIVRKHGREDKGLIARAIDGRGGDGGIDIDLIVKSTGQLITVYQLKYFREGFSGYLGKTRKDQIKKSFSDAMNSDPKTWVLVFPGNLTMNERKWLTILRGDHKVRIDCIDRTKLDGMLADDPDAEKWAMRTPTKEALTIVGRDTAALSSPGDLAEEVRRLNDRANARSAFWGFDVSVVNGMVTQAIRAKHPDADKREPLAIRFTPDFSNDRDLGDEFQRSMDFGVTHPLTLQSDVIKSFEQLGPEWFAHTSEGGILEILPSDDSVSRDAARVTVSPNGGAPITLKGHTTRRAIGAIGATLILELNAGITMTWRVPKDRHGKIDASVTFTPPGHDATSVSRAIRFLNAVSGANEVELQIEEQVFHLSTAGKPGDFGIDESIRELADDLAYIERELDIQFDFPELEPKPLDRVWIRTVRRILEGRCVIMPGVGGMDVTLSGELDDVVERTLNADGIMVFTQEPWTIDILGEPATLADVSFFTPAVQADDAEEHLAALRAGDGAGRRVHLRPVEENGGFRIYSPSRFPADAEVVPEPWGLPGIREHPSLRA